MTPLKLRYALCLLWLLAPQAMAQLIGGGISQTCAVTQSGGAQCWGWNFYGQLGDGTSTDRSSAVNVVGLTGVTALGAGLYHACAIGSGTVSCWGDVHSSKVPVTVSGVSGAVALATGGYHDCAITAAGLLQCWGRNNEGQLGDGSTTSTARTTAMTVPAMAGASAVVAGNIHTCAILNGTVKCWGGNDYGQLGDGSTTQRHSPVSVPGIAGASALAAGNNHSCALVNGTVRCWGLNSFGQLGDGSFTNSSGAVSVSGISDAVALSAGGNHTCALLSGGTAKCWGKNGNGQLGDGSTTTRLTPVTVAGLSGIVALGAGSTHTCATLSNGTAKCWGDNAVGQLGDGSTSQRTTAVTVSNVTAPTFAAMTISGNPQGSQSALSLTAQITVAAADAGLAGQLYVAAILPNGQVYALSNGSWSLVVGTNIPAFAAVTFGKHSLTLLSAMDVSGLAGTAIYVGYGKDLSDLLNNAKYARVHLI